MLSLVGSAYSQVIITNVWNKGIQPKKFVEQKAREKKVVQRKKDERNSVVIQHTRKVLQHDHEVTAAEVIIQHQL